MHAFYVFGIVPLPHPPIPDLLRYAYNGLLILFIINYSLFTDSGWWSVVFDLFYLYFLPFIYIGRLCSWIGRLSFRSFKHKVIWKNPQLILDSTLISAQPPATQKANKAIKETLKICFYHRLSRIFLKFALLWSLLILSVNSKPFLVFAVAVSLLGAARAILNLWGVFSGESTWVDKFETALAMLIEKYTKQIAEWDGRSSLGEVRAAINSLKFYGAVFNFVSDNSSLLTSWAFAISIMVSVPFYCYISFLFSCVYVGIAKLAILKFSLPEAFVDSLFMPFAWSALPADLSIKFIAGLQATCVLIIGYNVLFRHLGNRLDRITKVAAKLREPIHEESFKLKMSTAEGLLSQTASGSRKTSTNTKPKRNQPKSV